jgi:hypothetical protein
MRERSVRAAIEGSGLDRGLLSASYPSSARGTSRYKYIVFNGGQRLEQLSISIRAK